MRIIRCDFCLSIADEPRFLNLTGPRGEKLQAKHLCPNCYQSLERFLLRLRADPGPATSAERT